jgi:hypothetical protein
VAWRRPKSTRRRSSETKRPPPAQRCAGEPDGRRHVELGRDHSPTSLRERDAPPISSREYSAGRGGPAVAAASESAGPPPGAGAMRGRFQTSPGRQLREAGGVRVGADSGRRRSTGGRRRVAAPWPPRPTPPFLAKTREAVEMSARGDLSVGCATGKSDHERQAPIGSRKPALTHSPPPDVRS